MRILQINKLYDPVVGGIETTVKHIAEKLNGRQLENNVKLEIDVLACRLKGKRLIEEKNGVKIYQAASFGKMLGLPLSFDFFPLFFKIYKNYDLIIIHYPFPLAAIISPFIDKKKLIIFYHSDIVRQKLSYLPFSPFIANSLKRARKIITGGENIIYYSKLLKNYSTKCLIAPFGYDYQEKDGDQEEARLIKNNYPGPLILGVGRLVYYKGFKYLIEAMRNVDGHLLIIGKGPEKNKLDRLIKKYNLEKKISIIDFRPRLQAYFLACDLFVFPSCSRSEAFGLVQLEALAAGKAIINTKLNTAVEEVSVDGVSGLSVEKRNPVALAAAINKLINDKELMEKFGRQARERYENLYTSEKFIGRMEEIIKKLA